MKNAADITLVSIDNKAQSADRYNADIAAFFNTSLLMNTLEEIASAASRKNINFILLKGGAMVASKYDLIQPRPMTDLDLLIRDEDYLKWFQILSEKGFDGLPYSKSSFVRKITVPEVIDLHTSLKFIMPQLLEDAWKNSIKVDYNGVEYNILSPEIDILYRSLHLTITHGYCNEKWMKDIDILIRYNILTIDWEKIKEYYRICRAYAPFLSTLEYLRKNFDTPVPVEIIRDLHNVCQGIQLRIFSNALVSKDGIPFFDYLAPLLIQPSFKSIIIYIGLTLFPPIEIMRRRYGTDSKIGIIAMYFLRLLQTIIRGGYALIHSTCLIIRCWMNRS